MLLSLVVFAAVATFATTTLLEMADAPYPGAFEADAPIVMPNDVVAIKASNKTKDIWAVRM